MHFFQAFLPIAVLALAACGPTRGESCVVVPTSVRLTSDFDGTVPTKVMMQAAIEGGTCGCCGGKPQAKISSVRWFVDGVEQAPPYDPIALNGGPQTTLDVWIQVELASDARRVVEVEVKDSDGDTTRTPFVFFRTKQ